MPDVLVLDQHARRDWNEMIERPESLSTRLANAAVGVANAQDHLARMAELADAARRDETNARNLVNEAQRNFDILVAEVRNSATRGTDWRMAV